MTIPNKVQKALDAVREVFPEVSIVTFNSMGKWIYTDEDFNAPNFQGKIDVGILEDALDDIEFLPCVYEIVEIID